MYVSSIKLLSNTLKQIIPSEIIIHYIALMFTHVKRLPERFQVAFCLSKLPQFGIRMNHNGMQNLFQQQK